MATISIVASSARLNEGAPGGSQSFTFTVRRLGLGLQAGEVGFEVAGLVGAGTNAASGADFVGGSFPTGLVSFAAEQTEATVTVLVAGDAAAEANERFSVMLTTVPGGDTIEGGTAQGIILNNGTSLAIGPGNVQLLEGSGGGTTDFTFTVYRDGAANGEQTVDWAVAGAARAGVQAGGASDFAGGVLPTGTLTFAPGDSSKTITVSVQADSVAELNEAFSVTLSNATGGAAIGKASATGTVINDDGSRYSIHAATPVVTGGVGQVTEGTGGTTDIAFRVTRTGFGAGTDTLDWAVAAGTAPGTDGVDGADFDGGVLPSGTVTFAPGETFKIITLSLAADAADEGAESLSITLSNPSASASIGRAGASAVVADDDTAPPAEIPVDGDNDVVTGTEGDDVFLLSAGLHSVAGLGGVDRFVLAPAGSFFVEGKANVTVIADFNPDGGERIDLSRLDANLGVAGLDAFNFIGTNAFSSTAGELAVIASDASTQTLGGDVNGDGTADFVLVVGSTQPAASNWFTF